MDIETFPNPKPERDFIIQHVCEEFTSMCPKTGHPDFGRIIMTYVADEVCIELKSYKLYLHGYRNQGIYYESFSNKIMDDMIEAMQPRWMRIEVIMTGRGGIHSNAYLEYTKPGYNGPKAPWCER